MVPAGGVVVRVEATGSGYVVTTRSAGAADGVGAGGDGGAAGAEGVWERTGSVDELAGLVAGARRG